jgi:DNA-binding GntR family transcriptional regulator
MTNKDLSDILSPPLKRTLADEVTASIREAILGGRLAPGERLREESLASSMGVSRGPVREAIGQLQREGLVIVQRNRGTFVARQSVKDLEEVYSLRRAVEGLAVQGAIRNADDARLNELQAVVDTMAARYARGITESEAAELDLRFHELIYEASGHRRLVEVWSALQSQIHILLLTRNVVDSDFRELLINSHQALLDAIRARDEPLALSLLAEHLKGSYERVSHSHVWHSAGDEAANA